MKKLLICCLLLCLLALLPLAVQAEDPVPGAWNAFTHTYTDKAGETTEMAFELYFPPTYDGTTPLPLVTYIPDAGYVDRGVKAVETAECPKYWLTDELTAKYPAIWLIMDISDADSDVRVAGNQSAQIVPIIDQVCAA